MKHERCPICEGKFTEKEMLDDSNGLEEIKEMLRHVKEEHPKVFDEWMNL